MNPAREAKGLQDLRIGHLFLRGIDWAQGFYEERQSLGTRVMTQGIITAKGNYSRYEKDTGFYPNEVIMEIE